MEATSKQLPGATSTLSYSRVLQLAQDAGREEGQGEEQGDAATVNRFRFRLSKMRARC